MRVAYIIILCVGAAVVLAACGGGKELVARDCPPVNVLNTADRWQGAGDHVVQLGSAQLVCKRTKDGRLVADVNVGGTQNRGGAFPVFLAAVDEKSDILVRVQYRLTTDKENFELTLPNFEYGHIGAKNRTPQLLVGFVLGREALEANRAALRKSLRLD